MNHGSLFTGEGGFDLAAEWMGWDNIFHCELNDNLRWFLNKKWPKAKSYEMKKEIEKLEDEIAIIKAHGKI